MFSVMIVDDFDFFCEDLKSMNIWEDVSGFRITSVAHNGREALNILRSHPTDLLITDIRMPMIDGIELTKIVMNEKLSKIVILMSQFNDFEFARKGMLYGAFEYLLKPVEQEHLLAALQRASAYINERNMELTKINYVDQVLHNQVSENYPSEEFNGLISSIFSSASDVRNLVSKMLEAIWFEADFDLLKTSYIVNKMQKNVIDAVNKDFIWMKKLVNSVDAREIDFSTIKDIDDIKQSFLEFIKYITEIISKYQISSSDSSIIKTVCTYILENVDEELSLKILSQKMFISSSYLSILFKAKTGVNLIDYMTFIKMERARILLEQGTLKIYEIADTIGFSMEYFSKLFKKTYGLSPLKFRNTLLGKKQNFHIVES